jgi:hypothetical protein
VLIDFRDSTGYKGWKQWAKKGWDKLESYCVMEELRMCRGVFVEDGRLHGIELNACNLNGTSDHPTIASSCATPCAHSMLQPPRTLLPCR